MTRERSARARGPRPDRRPPAGPLALALALALPAAACGGPDGGAGASGVSARDASSAEAGGAEAPGPSGSLRVLALDELEAALAPPPGGRTLVNVWATWCAPCVAELPDLLAAARAAGPDARVVAISIDLAMPVAVDTPEGVAAFLRERELEGLDVVVYDGEMDALAERWDLPGPVPYTFVLDAEGDVVARHLGMAPRARFDALLAGAE